MADYRELLRKAIDALPENTGANRRAVYEKARSALVAQLRAIEPPLPAREITTHRLNLEDCIREVEHEATEKLLGRFRAVEEPEPQTELPVEPQPSAQEEPEPSPYEEPQSSPYEEPELQSFPAQEEREVEAYEAVPEPELEPDDSDSFEAPPAEDFEPEAERAEPVFDEVPADAREAEAVEPTYESEPHATIDDDRGGTGEGETFPGVSQEEFARESEASEELPAETAEVEPEAPAAEHEPYRAGSIEDIIASAERAAQVPNNAAEVEAQPQPAETDDHRVLPFTLHPERGPFESRSPGDEEKHFLLSEAEAEPRAPVSLVDQHGRPLGTAAKPTEPVPAMSSVREVDLEPGIIGRPEISDAQVAIDRAIAALDREARGETSETDTETEDAPAEEPAGTAETAEDRTERPGGVGAFTIFLVISILLLGGGGVAGYWAWREGHIDLNAVFAQGEATQPTTDVAQAEIPDTPEGAAPADGPAEPSATNTTPEVPATSGEVNGAPMPGESLPFTETETPSATPTEPEASFEDRLPAEADTPAEPDAGMLEEPGIALSTEGAQSLLLEEQSGGATGAVPYSGGVEWSRGTDELGRPTIVAEATIPARNLEVQVLLRRNADANLPASHLMEVNFTVAESFIGGSIANLPGVLLKDQELVQGQPLTGASARIVGNSFLFALSSASERDVENNLALLSERAWIDLAMVYGTGRRAILTLEKGPEGAAIFQDVMAAWAALDAEAEPEAEAEVEEGTDA